MNTIGQTGTALLAAVAGLAPRAQARLVRINAGPPVEINLQAFGPTGPYLKIEGTFEGELDAADTRNAVIADLSLAPRTGGKVRYTSTFMILRPADPGKGNRKLFYDFGNRGNKRILQWLNDGTETNDPTSAADFGNGFLMRQGYVVTWSGWDGEARGVPHALSIALPVPLNPDGSVITGRVLAEAIPVAPDRTMIALPYPGATTTAGDGVLTVRQHERDTRTPVEGWRWVDATHVEFPGPARVQWIYEFVYDAKDPKVMGIGHAATRDFLSFLKYADKDDAGNPNPLGVGAAAGGESGRNVEAVYSWGRSQGGERSAISCGSASIKTKAAAPCSTA